MIGYQECPGAVVEVVLFHRSGLQNLGEELDEPLPDLSDEVQPSLNDLMIRIFANIHLTEINQSINSSINRIVTTSPISFLCFDC